MPSKALIRDAMPKSSSPGKTSALQTAIVDHIDDQAMAFAHDVEVNLTAGDAAIECEEVGDRHDASRDGALGQIPKAEDELRRIRRPVGTVPAHSVESDRGL